MTQRDRLVVAVIVCGLIVGALWLKVVSPKRSAVASLESQIATQQSSLGQAQSELASARSSLTTYTHDVGTLKQLSAAVPPNDQLPALIRALSAASRSKHVVFQSMGLQASSTSGGSSGAAAPAAPAATGATGAAGAAGSGFGALTFNFTFTGTYVDLQHFLHEIDDNTVVHNGQVAANGRLLTVGSVALTPATTGAKGQATATVSAVAYIQNSTSPSTPQTGSTP
jgi:Tfp pilus assembly protein PilO